ncbi:MAG: hypothetical protein J6N19_10880, partial [Clostridium sp.]|nr:hypothetical protein [Clostridium sp.]
PLPGLFYVPLPHPAIYGLLLLSPFFIFFNLAETISHLLFSLGQYINRCAAYSLSSSRPGIGSAGSVLLAPRPPERQRVPA